MSRTAPRSAQAQPPPGRGPRCATRHAPRRVSVAPRRRDAVTSRRRDAATPTLICSHGLVGGEQTAAREFARITTGLARMLLSAARSQTRSAEVATGHCWRGRPGGVQTISRDAFIFAGRVASKAAAAAAAAGTAARSRGSPLRSEQVARAGRLASLHLAAPRSAACAGCLAALAAPPSSRRRRPSRSLAAAAARRAAAVLAVPAPHWHCLALGTAVAARCCCSAAAAAAAAAAAGRPPAALPVPRRRRCACRCRRRPASVGTVPLAVARAAVQRQTSSGVWRSELLPRAGGHRRRRPWRRRARCNC